jgi:hypothetical protein
MKETLGELTNADEVFDEITLVSPYVTASTASWNQKSSSPEDQWKDVFEHFSKLGRSVKNLKKLVEFCFSIPGSSCEVERLFSIIDGIWGSEKGQFNLESVESMLNVCYNSKITCSEFHQSYENDQNVLEEVQKANKYKKTVV